METEATMPRTEETTNSRRHHEEHPDTAERLLETAWRHCNAIQDIIDSLNEAGTNTEHTCSRTGCTAWPSGSGQSHRENRPTHAWRSDGVRATSPVKAARLQA